MQWGTEGMAGARFEGRHCSFWSGQAWATDVVFEVVLGYVKILARGYCHRIGKMAWVWRLYWNG